jgi:uncharacterized membrane protein HdeD (DUF308 family)
MKLPSNLGMLLLAIWLVVWGVIAFLPLFSHAPLDIHIILGLLAIVAGLLIFLGR